MFNLIFASATAAALLGFGSSEPVADNGPPAELVDSVVAFAPMICAQVDAFHTAEFPMDDEFIDEQVAEFVTEWGTFVADADDLDKLAALYEGIIIGCVTGVTFFSAP